MVQKYQQIKINKGRVQESRHQKNRQHSRIFWKQITTPVSNPTVQNN